MSYNGIEEAISQLYEIIQDARSVPLSSDKCMVERDQILDLLDEISNELPNELKQAKTIVDSRSEVITSAKRDAEAIRKQAQQGRQAYGLRGGGLPGSQGPGRGAGPQRREQGPGAQAGDERIRRRRIKEHRARHL